MADAIARSSDAVRDHVIRALKSVTLCDDEITDRTELYYDLGLYGEDLAEAIDAVREPFGTDFSPMDLRHYGPNEVGHNFGLNFVREFREWRGQRTYRSLTVASLIAAVQAGSWTDR
ncbi:hypothetical protein HNP47_001950 [Brevundimonas vesicularis]|uniref:DUF1493 domain-containing protein n=1 Tax=Brevundimonas vesicularis TaxID=41276 RepID=A0A7W9FUV9_BREVE|nr:DUF1493 family protein [Brevundimonas vesicularis]MBB5771946.1 hypothetical protein [Brevundimonas vesicularis]